MDVVDLSASRSDPPGPERSAAAIDADEATFIAEALAAEADAIANIARRAADRDRSSWTAALDVLAACRGHVVVAGMGKSGLIGAKISATFSSLGQPSSSLHPAEAVHGDLGRVRRGDVALLLSYSGNTEEVVNLAAILKSDEIPRVGLSGRSDSALARLCDAHVDVGDVTEACPLNLAPTASATAMLAVGDALALALARRRNFGVDDFHKHHPGGMLGAGLRNVTEALRFRVGVNLVSVPQDATVAEALDRTATDRRAGAMVVVDEAGVLSGIFTDGDFRRLMRQDPQGMTRRLGEVMTRHPKHLTTDDLVRDAVRLMRAGRLDEIPVVDAQGRPVGLIDVQDLIAMKLVSE